MVSQLVYMIRRLRMGIILTVLSLLLFIVLDIWQFGVSYLLGFLSGVLNHVLLTLSIFVVTNIKCKKPVLIQRLFFIVRYLLIVNILLCTVEPNVYGIIGFFIGLLSINFSVIASFCKYNTGREKEG